MQEYIDAVDMDVIITEVGIFVAGFAAVLGIWLERDRSKPPRYAWWLSLLIMLCTFVGMFQTLADAKGGEEIKQDMARMLATLDKIAQNSDVEIPELNEFVKSEVSAQARAHPDVVKKVAQRVADEGGDPAEMLSSYLPPSEVENVGRKGGLRTKVKKSAAAADAKPGDAPAEKKVRRKLEFDGKAKPREPKDSDKKGDDGGERRKLGGDRDDDKKGDRDRDDKKSDKDDDKKSDKDRDDKKSDKDRDDKKSDRDDKKVDKKDDKKDEKPKLGGPLPKPPGGNPPPKGIRPPGR